jgi:hypothetical protein
MTATKHTPGQWLYDAETGEVTMADDVTALIATVQFGGTDEAQADADGCLIGAAPDLLAALQSGEALIAGDLTGLEWKRACREFLAAARAAIARATQPNPANPLKGED